MKVVADAAERAGYKIAGLLDSYKAKGTPWFGYEVVGTEEDYGQLAGDGAACFVSIGDNAVRARVVQKMVDLFPNIMFATVVHPAAAIARGVEIGPGSVVMAGAVINPDTQVGEHCIVNTRASIDHDGSVGDFATVSPGACLGGNVTLGAHSVIGLGANVIHGMEIGAHTVVGAGSVVVRSLPERVVAMGVPCRVVRSREPGDRYL